MLRKVHTLTEVNPMLGHRGVRLGISFPEIYAMQIRAILEATAECMQEGVDVHSEIMVPQVVTVEELKRVKALMDTVRPEVEARYGVKLARQVRHDGRSGPRMHARRAARRRSPSSSRSAPTT